jgi:hypothetical protein
MASCSKDPFTDKVSKHPRRFEINGKAYILNDQEPGVVEDDIALYTDDAGARTFKYRERIVLTQRNVGECEAFASLARAKQRETEELATAALHFIRRLEIRQHNLSEIDRQSLEVFAAFLKNKSPDLKTPSSTSAEKQILEIPSWGKPMPTLLIEVPTGFKLSEYKGPDFYAYSFNSKSGQWGANMGIYLGHNPQYPWPKSASKQSGMVGSFPFVCQVWDEQGKGKTIYHRDAIIEGFFGCNSQIEKAPPRKLSLPYNHMPPSSLNAPPPPPPDPMVGLAIHIFIAGTDLSAVNAMAAWTESLRKKD